MPPRSFVGLYALAAVVVGMVVYRVIWFLRRERRRRSTVVWFKRDGD